LYRGGVAKGKGPKGGQKHIKRAGGSGYDRNSIAIAYNFTFENYSLNYFPM